MNATDIIKTSSKVFGLYFIVQTVTNLRDLFFNFYPSLNNGTIDDRMFDFFVSLSFNAIFNFLFGTILIFKADWIAKRIHPGETQRLDINLDKPTGLN